MGAPDEYVGTCHQDFLPRGPPVCPTRPAPMAEITICIPAYRSERFITRTLDSVVAQTFDDFEVVIGIEPAEAERTLEAIEPYLRDPRFQAHVNPATYGYAGNVGALFAKVRSPLFVALMHDDLWHSRFLEALHGALVERPEIVCAYPDVLCFAPGGLGAGLLSYPLDDASRGRRIISWLLSGASGNLWHGLCRSSVLDHPFPDNAYGGFAVECEWVLHLLSSGPVVRVPEPLYLKRQPASANPNSVSAAWARADATLPAALELHGRQLLAAIPPNLPESEGAVGRIAVEAVTLRREMEFADGRWGLSEQRLVSASKLLEDAGRLAPDDAAGIAAMTRWALSRHWAGVGDLGAAESETRQGLAAKAGDISLLVQLAGLLFDQGRGEEAMSTALAVGALAPDDPHVRLLLQRGYDQLFDRALARCPAGRA